MMIKNEFKKNLGRKCITINHENIIQHVSKSYSSSIHNKKLFINEYKNLCTKINKNISIMEIKVIVD